MPLKKLKRKPKLSLKLRLYEILEDAPCRKTTLHKTTGWGRPTINQHLFTYDTDGEVRENPRTREWGLTTKGIQVLHRMQDDLRRKQAPLMDYGPAFLYPSKHLSGLSKIIPPPGQINLARPNLHMHAALRHLPLIMPLKSSLYGSAELEPSLESATDFYQDTYRIESGKSIKERVLSEYLQNIGAQLLWDLIRRRLFFLLSWRHRYRAGSHMPHLAKPRRPIHSVTRRDYFDFSKPPPLTIEEILRFDVSVILDYHGKEAFPIQGKQAPRPDPSKKIQQLISKRLVGCLLLNLAYSDPTVKIHGQAMAQGFADSGLLKKRDASVLEKFIEQAEARNTAFNKKEANAIYDMAFRYFREADNLADAIMSETKSPINGRLPSLKEMPLWIQQTSHIEEGIVSVPIIELTDRRE